MYPKLFLEHLDMLIFDLYNKIFEAHIIMDTETENQSKLHQNHNKNIENSILI